MGSYSYAPPPSDVPLRILGRGASWVAIDKPAGLLSVPGRRPGLEDCARERVRAMFPEARGPMTMHRLDMDTSGVLLLALTPEAHRNLSIQFEKRRVEKAYEALLDGEVEGECGEIELPIAKDWPNRPLQKICFESGRWSATRWRVLGREGGRTRVRFEPITGRSHQLRIHAASELGLGVPIVGDRLYGDASSGDRLMLHASELVFRDPDTGRRVAIRSEAPF